MAEAVAEKKGKKIVVCCDGTGNKFIDDPKAKDSNSNVVKLYTTLKIDNDQIGYYHPGVGTAGDPRAQNWLEQQWSRLKGLAFAAGFQENVLDAYKYLMRMYDDGDQVFLIGFSRGAYTVRALAGLLDGYGLLCKGNDGHLEYAWNEYVKQHDNRTQTVVKPNHAFKETFSRKHFRVRFVGIWDTVSSVGWITTPLRLWNVSRAPIIDVGRHAISVDERRCFYRDNLWVDGVSVPGEVRQLDDRNGRGGETKQDVLQVWFPGVHSDVGGSYPQEESELSNAALEWLIREAKEAGANIKDNMVDLVMGRLAEPEDETDEWKIAELACLYKRPQVSKVHRSLQGAWWLLEFLPHRYYDLDGGVEQWRTPLGMWRRIPERAYMHWTVKKRLEDGVLGYRPKNLLEPDTSLYPVQVKDQPEGSLFEYRPQRNPQPLLNRTPVRWAVMLGVSTLDLAVVGGVLGGLWWLGKKALGR